jgi:MraZ protein
MTLFLGTHQNKLDAKGRVSIPALFRARLKANGESNGTQKTDGAEPVGAPMVLRPSHQFPCIEVWTERDFAALSAQVAVLDRFSPERRDLATALFSDAYQIETDKEGRIVLPEDLVVHAGLDKEVTFMGAGDTFEIWEPARCARRREEARAASREQGFTLRGVVLS